MARAFVVPPTLAREPRQARKGATVAVTSVWRGLFYWGRRFGAPRLAVPPLTSGLLRSPRRGLWPRRGARLFESAGEAARGAVRAGRMWLRSPCRGRRHRPLPGGGGGVPLRGERWRRRGFGGLAPLASGPSALGAAFGRVAERGCSSLRGRRPAGLRLGLWFALWLELEAGAAAWAVVRALARARARGWCCGLGSGSGSGGGSRSWCCGSRSGCGSRWRWRRCSRPGPSCFTPSASAVSALAAPDRARLAAGASSRPRVRPDLLGSPLLSPPQVRRMERASHGGAAHERERVGTLLRGAARGVRWG